MNDEWSWEGPRGGRSEKSMEDANEANEIPSGSRPGRLWWLLVGWPPSVGDLEVSCLAPK